MKRAMRSRRTSSRASSNSWKCELQSRQIGSNFISEVMRPIRSEILHGNCVDVRRDFDNELVPDSFVTNGSLPEGWGQFCGRSLARQTAPTSKPRKKSGAGRNGLGGGFGKRK